MKFLVLSCVLIILNVITKIECYDKVFTVNGYDYIFSGVKKNWHLANQHCRLRGSELIDFSSPKEHQIVVQLIKNITGPQVYQDFWTAGTDLGSEDNFYWVSTGKAFTYKNWCFANPSNTYFHNHKEHEHCVQLRMDGGYKWNDHVCSVPNYFICRHLERKTNSSNTLQKTQLLLLPCLILIGYITNKLL